MEKMEKSEGIQKETLEGTQEEISKVRMISAWEWVGIVLITYGCIVLGAGIFYIFRPETKTALAEVNPSLWWGGIMILFGIFLLIGGRRAHRFIGSRQGEFNR
jgi:hypothetical protein